MLQRRLAFRIVTPLAIILAAEAVARSGLDVRTRLGNAERRTFAAYRGMPAAEQYFHDLLDCNAQSARAHESRYARYLLQDANEDCVTPTVNYARRVRKTWNPDHSLHQPGPTVYEIGVFGGSTIEGQGAIDDETIPSQLSKMLNGHPGSVVYDVTNYGVGGYTFTQSVFKLMTLLREGRRFDAVIFYDGANDIDFAYNLGEAGALDEEDVVQVRLEGSAWNRLKQFGKEQMNACILCLAVTVVARHTPFLRDHLSPVLVRIRDAIHFKKGQDDLDDESAFAEAIASYYGQSHELLAKVAAAYHLPYLDLWQPSLLYDQTYAPGEEALANMDPRLTDTKLRALYAATRDRALAMQWPRFVDLSHALDSRAGACYLDAVHISGACNRLVAARIYQLWTGIEFIDDAQRE